MTRDNETRTIVVAALVAAAVAIVVELGSWAIEATIDRARLGDRIEQLERSHGSDGSHEVGQRRNDKAD